MSVQPVTRWDCFGGNASDGQRTRSSGTFSVWRGRAPTTVDNATFGGLMTLGSADQPIRPAHWDVTAQMLEALLSALADQVITGQVPAGITNESDGQK